MPDWLTLDNLQALAEEYRLIGTLLGILLPFIEAFLPFLPLAAFVIANASAYGLWIGFLLSWIGAVLGSYCVFLIVRKYGQSRLLNFVTKRATVKRLINWVEIKGFTPLFLLLCFPFTPSALVNIVAGLSNLKRLHFLFTIMASKLVMIFVISWIGSDLRALITDPIRTGVILLVIGLMWWGGKMAEGHLNAKVEEDMRSALKVNKKS
ncbi:TVP38/TMEM64 family protein [Viridibacillus sp. YIM B01967]|uniref:TVP38/TMEM64 family membrane protein n=1 Tax=Viridibacillus soli TaxID=2798301 RepID=A0ABS1H623_9BACL|nr:TVP38/TMEM64 family protein [Viridibacillus soli]MBK3494874.1 TVP38/TMEM64 family protein [Viridibacillus soli]